MITASILFDHDDRVHITLHPENGHDKSKLNIALTNKRAAETIKANSDGSFTLVILPDDEGASAT